MNISLRTRMITMIVVPTLVIYIVILGFAMFRLRADARHEVEVEMTHLASAYAARLDGAFRKAAAVAATTASFMETVGDLDEAAIVTQLTANTLQEPSIFGAAMAFEPGTVKPADELFCPYVYRDGEGVQSMNISREVFDWYNDPQWQWWSVPKSTGEGTWTEPYFDEGAGNVLMVTYSAPFFHDGVFRGVTTVDIMLPTLRENIGEADLAGLDFFILSKNGRFVYSPESGDIMARTVFDVARDLNEPALEQLGRRVTAGVPGVATIDGWGAAERMWVFYAPISSTGWSFAARIPEREALAPVRAQMTFAVGALAFTLALIVGCICFVSGRMTRPITRLRAKVNQIAQGDLEARVDGVNRRDEIGELAASFNYMTQELRSHIDRLANEQAAREKVERDLDLAREIQRGLLPRTLPNVPGFEISGWNQAAEKTGGDFFDWLQLPDGRTIVTLADVSGHGVGPALIVAVCRAYLRASASAENVDLCEAINRVNDLLHSDIPDNRFVTAAIGIIDPVADRMGIISAGHAPLLFYEASTGEVQFWEADTIPLGVMQGLGAELSREVRFNPGDVLILVTDGFFEWLNESGIQYGTERLVAFTKTHSTLSPSEFIRQLHEDVLSFAHGTAQADDLTALVIKRTTG